MVYVAKMLVHTQCMNQTLRSRHLVRTGRLAVGIMRALILVRDRSESVL